MFMVASQKHITVLFLRLLMYLRPGYVSKSLSKSYFLGVRPRDPGWRGIPLHNVQSFLIEHLSCSGFLLDLPATGIAFESAPFVYR